MDKYWVTIEDLSVDAESQEDAEERVWQWLRKVLPQVGRDQVIVSAFIARSDDRDTQVPAWIT